MTRHRMFVIGAAVAGLVAFGAAVHAQGPGRGGPMGHHGARFGHFGGPGGDLPLRALNLTDAQQQQVRGVREAHRANLQAAGQQLREAFEAQRNAVQQTPVDEGLIQSTTQALVTAQTALAIEGAHIRSEIFAILTAEQQAKVQEIQAERQARMKERMERMQQRRQQRQQKQG